MNLDDTPFGLSDDAAAITRENLLSLTKLTRYVFDRRFETQITDLSGIEHATNLTLMAVARNKVIDLTSLLGLSNLTSLDLTRNPLLFDDRKAMLREGLPKCKIEFE